MIIRCAACSICMAEINNFGDSPVMSLSRLRNVCSLILSRLAIIATLQFPLPSLLLTMLMTCFRNSLQSFMFGRLFVEELSTGSSEEDFLISSISCMRVAICFLCRFVRTRNKKAVALIMKMMIILIKYTIM